MSGRGKNWPYPPQYLSVIEPDVSSEELYEAGLKRLASVPEEACRRIRAAFRSLALFLDPLNSEIWRESIKQMIMEVESKNPGEENGKDLSHHVVLLLCIDVFLSYQSGTRWKMLLGISYHSTIFENTLLEFLALRIKEHPRSARFFKIFARNRILEFSRRPIPKIKLSERDESIVLSLWREIPSQSDLFRGYAHEGSLAYSLETEAFRALYLIDPDRFMGVINSIDSSFPVIAGLTGSFIFDDIDGLSLLIEKSRCAFSRDGLWSGSVVLPAALNGLVSKLLSVVSMYRQDGVSGETGVPSLDRVESCVARFVVIISNRKDFPGIIGRWSPNLILDVVHHHERLSAAEGAAFAGQYCVSDRLLRNLYEVAKSEFLSPESVSVDEREAWLYRCAITYVSDSPEELMSANEFLKDWTVTFDEWNLDESIPLLERAHRFLYGNRGPQSFLNQLLAASLDPGCLKEGWFSHLWETVYPLRDSVEFGFNTGVRIGRSLRCTEAGKLLVLLCSVALMRFDRSAYELDESSGDSVFRWLAELFYQVHRACEEMLITDKFHQDEWVTLRRHLVVRRFLHQMPRNKLAPNCSRAIFTPSDEPWPHSMLGSASCEAEELLLICRACVHNDVDLHSIRSALEGAGIDLSSVFNTFYALKSACPKRYPADYDDVKRVLREGG